MWVSWTVSARLPVTQVDGMMLRAWEAWTLFFITTIEWAIVQRLFVPIYKAMLSTRKAVECVRASSAHEATVEWNNSFQMEQNMHVMLSYRTWHIGKAVSSGCASAHQAQHPHVVFHQLELPRHCYIEGLLKLLVKHWLRLRVASFKVETCCFIFMNMGTTFSDR